MLVSFDSIEVLECPSTDIYDLSSSLTIDVFRVPQSIATEEVNHYCFGLDAVTSRPWPAFDLRGFEFDLRIAPQASHLLNLIGQSASSLCCGIATAEASRTSSNLIFGHLILDVEQMPLLTLDLRP